MPSWLPFRRVTAPLAETRAPLVEALSAGVDPERSARRGSGRATYPSADIGTEYQLKQNDVSNRARKITLYQAYLGESWAAACCDVIARRMVSGGWTLKPADAAHPNLKTREPLLELLNWCNPDESLSHILISMATDLGWAGEAYLEIVWRHHPILRREVPYELYTVDCLSMDYTLTPDKRAVAGYTQQTDMRPASGGAKNTIDLTTKQILRVWFPDPRNRLKALSPLEKLLNPVTWDQHMQNWEQTYFKQGNRGDLALDFANGNEDLVARTLKLIRERFLGVKNAHLPFVTFGGAKVTQLSSPTQLNILDRRRFARDEILSVYGVPPQSVGVYEHGGIGSGAQAEAADKGLLANAVTPTKQRLLEPFNFRVVAGGFGIDDWVLDTTYADLRDSQSVATVNKTLVESGQRTPNELRADHQMTPLDGGDTAVIVTPKEVVPLADLAHLVSSQRLSTAASLQGFESPEQAAAMGALPNPQMGTPPPPPKNDTAAHDGGAPGSSENEPGARGGPGDDNSQESAADAEPSWSSDDPGEDDPGEDPLDEGVWGKPHPHRGHPGKHQGWGHALKKGSHARSKTSSRRGYHVAWDDASQDTGDPTAHDGEKVATGRVNGQTYTTRVLSYQIAGNVNAVFTALGKHPPVPAHYSTAGPKGEAMSVDQMVKYLGRAATALHATISHTYRNYQDISDALDTIRQAVTATAGGESTTPGGNATLAELKAWERHVRGRLREGRTPKAWEPTEIPAALATELALRLSAVSSEADAKAIFDVARESLDAEYPTWLRAIVARTTSDLSANGARRRTALAQVTGDA